MWKKSERDHSRLLSFSPWILGTACLLLLMLLALFAVNNYQRERKLITAALEQKGLTLVRFINSSVRESIRGNLRSREEWQSWEAHMQTALEQAVEQPGVERIVILDSKGTVLLKAKSEVARLEFDLQILTQSRLFQQLSQKDSPGWSSLIYEDERNHHKNFIVVAFHRPPFFAKMGSRGGMNRKFRHHEHFQSAIEQMRRIKEVQPVFVVQLDFEQFSGPLQKQFIQIVLQLVVIMLVGIGGALSFLTLRGLKGTEQSLDDAKVFNEHMVASLPVGVLATDADGVIRICNGAALNILQLQKTIVAGQRPQEVLPEQLAEMLSNSIDGHENELDANIQLSCDGCMKMLNLISTSVRYKDGKAGGKVLLIRDLTRMKDLEKELQRSERLAALGKMAAGVAHELRNPLSSIKGLALLLKPYFQKGSNEAKNTDTLVKEVDRLNRGISELLDFARPTKLSKESVKIEEIVKKTLRLVEADASSFGIVVNSECQANLVPVLVDNDKISQVLLNVFLNAIQAMEGGKRDSQNLLSVVLMGNDGHQLIQVRDNGKGIPPDQLKKVFDPYFTTKNDGTGLGLALSAKIIEEHGGSIEIASAPAEGTEVTIQLVVDV